tara:strand:+ start:4676 stop:6367 length:1692 start_codon:yes stop_codon:yes gene_type:complete
MNFKFPIEYVKEKNKISDSLKVDLELLETTDTNSKPMYDMLLNPKTKVGKSHLKKWSEYYTTNIKYLKETQDIFKQVSKLSLNEKLIDDTFTSWTDIRDDNNFINKYHYIGWDKIKWLNYSLIFMHILSMYNLSSPVVNLLSPFALFLVPYFLLKSMRVPITWAMYKKILIKQLKNHALGQLFTSFHKVKMNQKVYILFCAGMYVYNFYQNILSCYNFYKNTYFITQKFELLRQYLAYTINNMKVYEEMIKDKEHYSGIYKDIMENRKKLEEFFNIIKNIPKKCLNTKNLFKMGSIMQNFYRIYDSDDLNEMLQYSFGFNGYIDNLKGLEQNKKKLNFTHFSEKKKTKLKMKSVFHPSIKNPVKNSINLDKNRIITGPNAAGKTTILKATILNTIFSQQVGMGFYKKCELTPFHHIHCYINIPDTCGRDSLFQAEARRCKDILEIINEHPKEKHFCVFDELYSGTNPYEAISAAYGYLKYIIKNKNVKFLLTTHFINLCKLLEKEEEVENNSMHTIIENDIPKYKYKIIKGISDVKGGITVLKELDYPEDIIEISRGVINKLN